jgi:hypothetical protein
LHEERVLFFGGKVFERGRHLRSCVNYT